MSRPSFHQSHSTEVININHYSELEWSSDHPYLIHPKAIPVLSICLAPKPIFISHQAPPRVPLRSAPERGNHLHRASLTQITADTQVVCSGQACKTNIPQSVSTSYLSGSL